MSRVSITGNVSGTGTFTIAAPNSNNNRTLTLPDQTGTVLTGSGAIGVNASTPTNSLVLDASGNVGVGVTPSAWGSSYRALQVGYGGAVQAGNGTFPTYVALSANTYIDSTPANKYLYTAAATQYAQNGGAHIWYNAPSGTAGNTISFTQAMTLDASGNLGVGTASPTTKLKVNAASAANGVVASFENSGSTGAGISLIQAGVDAYDIRMPAGSNALAFYSSGVTERMRITAGGEVYIAGTTDQGAYNLQCNGTGVWGAGAYVNGSDARIKEDVSPITSGLDVVAKLKPVQYRYKESWSKDTELQPGFVAQEVQAALEGKDYVAGVVKQGPEYLSVAYQTLIPVLTKAIQELKAEVDSLKAQLK